MTDLTEGSMEHTVDSEEGLVHGDWYGHVIRCSCGIRIEIPLAPVPSAGVARNLAHDRWGQHKGDVEFS